MLIKKLKYIFEVENDKELAEILKVNTDTLSKWYRKEKANPPWPLPTNIRGMLEIIYKQQKEIQNLQKKLKINESEEV